MVAWEPYVFNLLITLLAKKLTHNANNDMIFNFLVIVHVYTTALKVRAGLTTAPFEGIISKRKLKKQSKKKSTVKPCHLHYSGIGSIPIYDLLGIDHGLVVTISHWMVEYI
jgi:hypothetical protein